MAIELSLLLAREELAPSLFEREVEKLGCAPLPLQSTVATVVGMDCSGTCGFTVFFNTRSAATFPWEIVELGEDFQHAQSLSFRISKQTPDYVVTLRCILKLVFSLVRSCEGDAFFMNNDAMVFYRKAGTYLLNDPDAYFRKHGLFSEIENEPLVFI